MNMGIKLKAFLPIKLTEFFFNIGIVKDFKALEGWIATLGHQKGINAVLRKTCNNQPSRFMRKPTSECCRKPRIFRKEEMVTKSLPIIGK